MNTGDVVRVLVAAAYAVYALVLYSLALKTGWDWSASRGFLMGAAILASILTLTNTFGVHIPPWPAAGTRIFIVILTYGTVSYARRRDH